MANGPAINLFSQLLTYSQSSLSPYPSVIRKLRRLQRSSSSASSYRGVWVPNYCRIVERNLRMKFWLKSVDS